MITVVPARVQGGEAVIAVTPSLIERLGLFVIIVLGEVIVGAVDGMAEIAPVVDYLGRATAKVHCVADSDADHTLVPFQTEEAIARVVAGREEDFVSWVVEFAHDYAALLREDHALFVDAFRGGAFEHVAPA